MVGPLAMYKTPRGTSRTYLHSIFCQGTPTFCRILVYYKITIFYFTETVETEKILEQFFWEKSIRLLRYFTFLPYKL